MMNVAPLSRSPLPLLGLLAASFLASGCMVKETRPLPKIAAVQATQQIPDNELLDVAIHEFEPGIPKELAEDEDALAKRRIYPDVRKAEAKMLPATLRTLPSLPRQAVRRLPRVVHTVPVIICADDGGSLPIARAPPALSSESATRTAAGPLAIPASCRRPTMCGGVTTCRRLRHSGVRTQTCAPARHPSDQRGTWIVPPLTRRQPTRPHQARERRPTRRRPEGPPIAPRSSGSVPGPCSIRSSWPRSGRPLLAPTSPIAY